MNEMKCENFIYIAHECVFCFCFIFWYIPHTRVILIDRFCDVVVGDFTDSEARVRFPALPIFVRSLERDSLCLVSENEELLGRNSSGYGL
jgi:hypothetical protein